MKKITNSTTTNPNNNLQPINYSSNFGDRIVEFCNQLDRSARVKDDSIDSGDVFKALDRYIIRLSFLDQMKDLITENEENIDYIFNPKNEQCKKIAYNQSGLPQMLDNIEFYEDNPQSQNTEYDKNANKLKSLLSIYNQVMSNNSSYRSDADNKEFKTASELQASITPIPGAPSSWCNYLGKIFLGFLIITFSLLAALPKET